MYEEQWREEMEYELNARYDYLREAYGPTAVDAFADYEYEVAHERREQDRALVVLLESYGRWEQADALRALL